MSVLPAAVPVPACARTVVCKGTEAKHRDAQATHCYRYIRQYAFETHATHSLCPESSSSSPSVSASWPASSSTSSREREVVVVLRLALWEVDNVDFDTPAYSAARQALLMLLLTNVYMDAACRKQTLVD